jgi:hypothetical protein
MAIDAANNFNNHYYARADRRLQAGHVAWLDTGLRDRYDK